VRDGVNSYSSQEFHSLKVQICHCDKRVNRFNLQQNLAVNKLALYRFVRYEYLHINWIMKYIFFRGSFPVKCLRLLLGHWSRCSLDYNQCYFIPSRHWKYYKSRNEDTKEVFDLYLMFRFFVNHENFNNSRKSRRMGYNSSTTRFHLFTGTPARERPDPQQAQNSMSSSHESCLNVVVLAIRNIIISLIRQSKTTNFSDDFMRKALSGTAVFIATQTHFLECD